MRRFFTYLLSLTLMCSVLLSFCGCGMKIYALELSESYTSNNHTVRSLTDGEKQALCGFALRLFGASLPEKGGTLVSPLSVLLALGMLENGAEGQTLEQMEALTGLDRTVANEVLKSYGKLLCDTGCLKTANSIWFREGSLSVLPSFLQTNADYYGADAFSAPFNDTTVRDINRWVSLNTDKMIEKLLDDISPETMMYLINALAFDAKWQTQYKKSATYRGVFHGTAGDRDNVQMMKSEESTYLRTDSACGFIKPYKNGDFSFVAVLPNEDVDFYEYLSSFDYAEFSALMTPADRYACVNATMPAFENEYSMSLIDCLRSMGMTDAFEPENADFDGIGGERCDLFVSEVIHKTFISVDTNGTRAAAVTNIGLNKSSAMLQESYTVTLDRPFIYMITDSTYGIPVFIGAVTDIR